MADALRTVSRFGVPDLGVGVGYRVPHYGQVLRERPAMDWFEVLSENFMVAGGSPRRHLDGLREGYRTVPHGVSLSLGGRGDPEHLRGLVDLVRHLGAPWVSDHLCFTGSEAINAHDLLPLPFVPAMKAHLVARIRAVQDAVGVPFAVENVSSYLTYRASLMDEWDFLAEVAEEADCALLLDVNNVFVSSVNHGFDPHEYLRRVPLDRVVQVHLAGHSVREGYRLDTHDAPVCDEVWDLYRAFIAALGPVSTLIEWDGNIPEFARLQAEAERAREVRDIALQGRSPGGPQGEAALDPRPAEISLEVALPTGWQDEMVAQVASLRPLSGDLYVGSPALSPTEQIGVYRDQYDLRLVDALAEDLGGFVGLLGLGLWPDAPRSAHPGPWCGHDGAEPVLRAYLDARPSRSWSLTQLADGFEAWLAAQGAPEVLVEMAWLERAVQVGFLARDARRFDVAALQSGAPLTLPKAVSLRRARFPVHLWRSVHLTGEGELPELVPGDHPLVVFRRDLGMRHAEIPLGQFSLLERLGRGEGLGEALGALVSEGIVPVEVLQRELGGWCRDFVERQWLEVEG